jgi:bifunctional N-acetylglucosamine-1-phosphate-uridyltransferase/glucosamine-1-phosphate-acetyltransferase GlmU-like protein
MAAQTKPLVIIPAAGFGRRVGSPNSKEMLAFEGRPLIEFVLRECEARDWSIHVVTRAEKTELLGYLEERQSQSLKIQLVSETREWPETVLRSEPNWQDWNLLLLPDMIFDPPAVLDQMQRAMLSGSVELVAAGRIVNEPQVWGCLRTQSFGFEISEKPQDCSTAWAWGILGFRRSLGRPLFQSLLESGTDHAWKSFPRRALLFDLLGLKDLTR